MAGYLEVSVLKLGTLPPGFTGQERTLYSPSRQAISPLYTGGQERQTSSNGVMRNRSGSEVASLVDLPFICKKTSTKEVAPRALPLIMKYCPQILISYARLSKSGASTSDRSHFLIPFYISR